MPVYRIDERIITPGSFPWGHRPVVFLDVAKYPPAYDGIYAKATTFFSSSYYPWFSFNPSLAVAGAFTNTQWLSASGQTHSQRLHVDLGEAFAIQSILYENCHHNGGYTNSGVKDLVFQGSNNVADFDDTVFANDGTWVDLWTGALDQHIASNVADPKYIELTNTTPYRYYAFKCVNCYGSGSYLGIRHIELRTKEQA